MAQATTRRGFVCICEQKAVEFGADHKLHRGVHETLVHQELEFHLDGAHNKYAYLPGGGLRVINPNGELSIGTQGDIIAVFLGKLDNYEFLKSKYCPELGPHKEADLICHLFTALGANLASSLEGCFALCLYDAKLMRVYTARSPSGRYKLQEGRTPKDSLVIWSGPFMPPGTEETLDIAPGHSKYGWHALPRKYTLGHTQSHGRRDVHSSGGLGERRSRSLDLKHGVNGGKGLGDSGRRHSLEHPRPEDIGKGPHHPHQRKTLEKIMEEAAEQYRAANRHHGSGGHKSAGHTGGAHEKPAEVVRDLDGPSWRKTPQSPSSQPPERQQNNQRRKSLDKGHKGPGASTSQAPHVASPVRVNSGGVPVAISTGSGEEVQLAWVKKGTLEVVALVEAPSLTLAPGLSTSSVEVAANGVNKVEGDKEAGPSKSHRRKRRGRKHKSHATGQGATEHVSGDEEGEGVGTLSVTTSGDMDDDHVHPPTFEPKDQQEPMPPAPHKHTAQRQVTASIPCPPRAKNNDLEKVAHVQLSYEAKPFSPRGRAPHSYPIPDGPHSLPGTSPTSDILAH